jgi:hypothetical protein
LESPERVIKSNLHLDAEMAESETEARRLMDLADQEETCQNYIDWHNAHVNVNQVHNGFWEDPVKAHEADLYWSGDAIPASFQWDDPGAAPRPGEG